jgi:hypothetical protein
LEIIYIHSKTNEYDIDELILDLKKDSIERPLKKIIYSDSFIQTIIGIYEKK